MSVACSREVAIVPITEVRNVLRRMLKLISASFCPSSCEGKGASLGGLAGTFELLEVVAVTVVAAA